MNLTIFFYFLIINLFKPSFEIIYNSGENWAVLACGSTGYINYRHQADIFQVYHTLINNGFSKDHIILFAYDDIAYDRKNPFPGEIYNRPDGPNVYSGVIIDYSFNTVTPENYISVLKGDTKNGSLQKVLNSTKDDNIFLYFSDHGINGALVFPDNQFLYADELNQAFIYMKEKGMYKNIIYYIEACYSGSIFNELNNDLNIYAMTAASPKEKSFATFCYPDDYVKGREMHTCLSNEFTNNWLEDILSLNNNNFNDLFYSSREQYEVIRNKTKNSHVQEYGNLNVGELPISLFQYSNDSLNYNDDKEQEQEQEKEKEKEEETIDDEEDDDEFDYDEIKRRIIEYDKEEGKENSAKNFYDLYDYLFENNKYNFINYIIDRNKHLKKLNQDKEDIISRLRGGKKKLKKLINTIPSQNVKLYYLQVETNKNPEKFKDYQEEIAETEKSKNLFYLLKLKLNISEKSEEQNKKIDFKCLRFSIQLFKEKCSLNERDLEFISIFSDICAEKFVNLDEIKNAIIDVCKNRK